MPDHALFSSAIWNRLPIVTMVLVILLSVVFGVTQYLDEQRLDIASAKYQDVGLLGAEAPRYLEYLERRIKVQLKGDIKELERLKGLMSDGDTNAVSKVILRDRIFYQHLVDEGHVFWLSSQYKEWDQARTEHIEPIVSELIPYRFGLVAGSLTLADLFTHFFLHTTLLPLVLNICFALAFVIYLEERVGKARVFIVFIGGGAVSGLLNVLFADEGNLILGASGSIAALIGLYAAYAYDHGVEPRFEKLRVLTKHNLAWIALVLLLLAIKEVLEWYWSLSGNLSFIGHLLALILGTLSYQAFKETVHDLDEIRANQAHSTMDQEFKKEYARALEHLSRLEFKEAKSKLVRLHQEDDTNLDVLRQLYRLEKLVGPSKQYWQYTAQLIALIDPDKAHLLAREILEDLVQVKKKDPDMVQQLDSKILNKLMMVFINANEMNDAERVYQLLQMSDKNDLLQEACLVLSQAFKARGRDDKVRQYKNTLNQM